ncbi:MAG: hypothetical protein QOH25_3085 [Acidobacteriota bacterium]|nr:hypothetical protein [Acidobacteriota bacterium]
MVTTRQNPDFICCDLVDKPVLLIYSSRPAACKFMLERFGLPNAFKWLTLDIFYQLNNPQSFLTILLDPPG